MRVNQLLTRQQPFRIRIFEIFVIPAVITDIILGKGPLLKMGGAPQTSRWCQSNHRTLFSVKSVKTDSHTHTEQPYAARLVE